MTQVALLIEVAWKGTLILAGAFVAAGLLWRASAAVRHFLWTVAFGALLLLPVATSILPRWKVQPVVNAVVAGDSRTAPLHNSGPTAAPSPVEPSRSPWLLVWAAGCVMAAARFTIGAAHTRGILRRARPAQYAQHRVEELRKVLRIRRRVRVVEAADAAVPLTCGVLQPAIVLPHGAAGWEDGRLLAILRHELAHIRRYDVAAQTLEQAACCIYWFHPLAWIGARRLRQERERACDDVVLAGGAAPHEYAATLLDVARGLAARRHVCADAPAMAAGCDLETRVRALLDDRRNRRSLRAKTAAAIGAAAVAVLLPTASLTMHAQPARGSVTGVVQDPSHARVPDCQASAKNQDGTNRELTRTNAAGEYRFGAIPPGNYVLEFSAPGFALMTLNAVVKSDQALRLDAMLEMGAVSERMTVRGQKSSTVIPAPGGGPAQRIRVGGNVQPLRLVQQTTPAYPDDLQQLGVEGTVVISAVISTDGSVLSPYVVNTDIDPRLAQLALDAVKQWRYEPSRLNGQPVETTTTLTIDFTLESRGVKLPR